MGVVISNNVTVDYSAGNVVSLILDNISSVSDLEIINVPTTGTPAELTLFLTASVNDTMGVRLPPQSSSLGLVPSVSGTGIILIPTTVDVQVYKLFSNNGGDDWYVTCLSNPSLDILAPVPDVGDVLTFDGSVWTHAPVAAGGLTFFTETRDTSVGASHVFTATGAEARIEAALIPKGDGGISASNQSLTPLRGIKSVDWQMSRTNSSQIAAGNYTVIGGGADNIISSTTTHSVIAGGLENVFSGISSRSFIGGGQDNNISGATNCAIGGGDTNIIQNCTRSFIGGGESHILSVNYGTIGGGLANSISGVGSFIGGGQNNSVGTGSTQAVVCGGDNNDINVTCPRSVIVGGQNNDINSSTLALIGCGNFQVITGCDNGTIGGGGNNTLTEADYATISGGISNAITGTGNSCAYSTVAGGIQNVISQTSNAATISGGESNVARGSYSTIPGGRDASTRGTYGRMAYSSGSFGLANDCQISWLVCRAQTIGSPLVVTSDGSGVADATNVLVLNVQSMYGVSVTVSACDTGLNIKRWRIELAAKRGTGVGSITVHGVASTVIYEDAGATAWTAVASADTALGAVVITVDGGGTISWLARYETEEIRVA